jgi:AraC-like DNA-binding protein
MNYRETIVSNEHLKENVLCFWQMEGHIPTSENVQSRHLPKGQNLLIFNFGDEVRSFMPSLTNTSNAPFFIVPALNSSIMIRQSGEINLFGVSFIGDGLYRLIQTPVAKLSKSFPDKWRPEYQCLYEELKNLSFETKNEVMQSFLLQHLDQKRKHPKFVQAIASIKASGGSIKISSLCDELQISSRQLQRLFDSRLGISPKDYCRIIRVNNYLDFILKNDKKTDWMDLVVEFDYHDQSHLINELKSISKLPPQKLIEYRDTLYHRYIKD